MRTHTTRIQRRAARSGFFFQPIMRKCIGCEEKEGVQRKESGGSNASGQTAPLVVSEVLSPGGGQPMEGGTCQFMESRFGQKFSQVRIHTDARAAESASAIQARAYTSGRDVVFGRGEYQPSSEVGKRLLAHELAHVQQQNGGQQQVQRAMEERPGLTSPRFKDYPALQACYHDKARLTINARGKAVAAIQQALIDLGYDLGPNGTDGEYGNFTWNAVRKFKKDQHLGWEHMGDVGPGTMGRLNEMFPSYQPPAPPVCPQSEESTNSLSETSTTGNRLCRSSGGGGGGEAKNVPDCTAIMGGRGIRYYGAGLLFNHTYVNFKENAENFWLIEGGPLPTDANKSGAWAKSKDWENNGNRKTTTFSPDRCQEVKKLLFDTQQTYHDATHPYDPWNGPNSNSFAEHLTYKSGVPADFHRGDRAWAYWQAKTRPS